MTFASPLALAGLVLVPLALAGYVVAQRRRTRYAVRFTNLNLLANLVERAPGRRRHVPAALLLLSLAALVVALARPQVVIAVPREQGTVILTMDTSGSMNATDVAPSRMIAAREAAQGFVEKLPDKFRVGVVSFASGATVVARPTRDRPDVAAAIASLRARGGTAIGDALALSLDLGRIELARDRAAGDRSAGRLPLVVLLLSDGKQTQGAVEPAEAAAEAADLGVPVFTIALGTDEGTVEVENEFGFTETIAVPPDRVTLRHIARRTRAQAFDAPDEENLRRIYDELRSRVGYVDAKREITVAFTAAGGLLLLAGAALSALWFGRIP